jgi:DNA-directed RNA polymerase subunit RPC12/RpoP
MFCTKCGIQLPDDAVFCVKCGTKQNHPSQTSTQNTQQTIQQNTDTSEVKCPSCGAPISPKFGEMVVTCEYCGSSVSLENKGWQNVAKHSMLPINITDRDQITTTLHSMMDKGLLHRHLQENSTLGELDLTMVPYWIIPVSARTNLVATDIAAEVGGIAATAAMAGLMGSAMSGDSRRGGGFGGGMMDGMLFGTMMGGGGMMGGANATKAYTVDESYDCPVVAVKSLTAFQPHGYEFSLDNKIDFDPKKVPKAVKILNGDINDETAKSLAKNIIDQIQSQAVHAKYHMIRQMQTELEVSPGELLHIPIWFAQYDHKGKKIILIIDANSGNAINSIGL